MTTERDDDRWLTAGQGCAVATVLGGLFWLCVFLVIRRCCG